ncbi:MAG: DUF4175 family protein [Alphaproteobacteria bacterium]
MSALENPKNAGTALTAPAPQAFSDPAAQHLAALGHALMDRPMERLYVARELQTLTETPEALGDNPSIYLSLRTAYWQLRRDPQVEGSIDAAMILWDAADALEVQHHVSSASRSLRVEPVRP